MHSRVIAGVGAFVLVVGVAACEGDDDGTSGEEGALSRSEFVQQADQVCADLTENGALVVNERLIGRVDDLVPPQSEQDTVTGLLSRWRDYFDQPSEQAATAADDIAHQLGLDKCVIDT